MPFSSNFSSIFSAILSPIPKPVPAIFSNCPHILYCPPVTSQRSIYAEGLIVAAIQNTPLGYLVFFYKIYPRGVFVKKYFLIPAISLLTKTDPYDLHLHDSVTGLGKETE